MLGIANERLRPDTAATGASLTTLTGTPPMLVTGDNPRAAARLAAEIGITDVRAGLLPQDKVAAVRKQEQAGRKVLVVGDGVNDARPHSPPPTPEWPWAGPVRTSPWRPPTR